MKKALILFLSIFISNFTKAQYNSFQHQASTPSNSNSPILAAAFTNFENAVFTQSDIQNIIYNYIELGNKHKDLGHSVEAVSFYKRAYDLAKDYYSTSPEGKNPIQRIKNTYQSLLAFCGPNGLFFTEPNGDKTGAVHALQYLRKSERNWTAANNQGLSEEKVVTSFFLAATEEASEEPPRIVRSDFGFLEISKTTSLRQGATHRSKSLKRLSEGKQVRVLEKTSQHWWKVEVNGLVGYAKALLLE